MRCVQSIPFCKCDAHAHKTMNITFYSVGSFAQRIQGESDVVVSAGYVRQPGTSAFERGGRLQRGRCESATLWLAHEETVRAQVRALAKEVCRISSPAKPRALFSLVILYVPPELKTG